MGHCFLLLLAAAARLFFEPRKVAAQVMIERANCFGA